MPIELIVVVAPSADDTDQEVRSFFEERGSEFTWTEMLQDPGNSLSYARRMGAAASAGQVVVFLDGDMALTAGFCRSLLSKMEGLDVLAPAIEVASLDQATRAFRTFLEVFDEAAARVDEGGVVPQIRAFSSDALARMGGYPLLSRFFAEDRLATAYSLKLGLRYAYEPSISILKLDSPSYVQYVRKHARYGRGIHTDLTAPGKGLLRDYLLLRRIAYVDLPLPITTTAYLAGRLRRKGQLRMLTKVLVIKWLIDFGMLAGELAASLRIS